VTLLSALAVLALLLTTFGFVLAVLRRVPADRELSVSIRLLPLHVEVKVIRPSNVDSKP
jgi:hypothetical protein